MSLVSVAASNRCSVRILDIIVLCLLRCAAAAERKCGAPVQVYETPTS